jgi:hypothetical protein
MWNSIFFILICFFCIIQLKSFIFHQQIKKHSTVEIRLSKDLYDSESISDILPLISSSKDQHIFRKKDNRLPEDNNSYDREKPIAGHNRNTEAITGQRASPIRRKLSTAMIAISAFCFSQLVGLDANAAVTLVAPPPDIFIQKKTIQNVVTQKKSIQDFDVQKKPVQLEEKKSRFNTAKVDERNIPADVITILRDRFTVLRSDVTGEKVGLLRVGGERGIRTIFSRVLLI